jgi:HPt (histidine-containing phosphotransfer) domain-containing protein
MSSNEIDLATFEELRQMSGADFINELVDTFLDDAPRLIDGLRSALFANDADSFRRAAHSLKSNGATFGARRLSELAKQLEMLAKENRLGDTGDRLETLENAYQAAAVELKGLRT